MPLGWARPGRTLERLDPFDPAHENHLMVIAGKSGGGKTMTTNLILARILAQGAQGGVIDRAGHYEFLASLIPDAVVINLGTDTGQAINPWDVDRLRQLRPEKLEYLLALHSFFLGRPLPDGTYDLEPRDHSQLSLAIRAVYRRCRADRRAAARDAAAGGALPPRARKPAATGTSSSPRTSRSSPRGFTTMSATAPARYLADRATQHPGGLARW